MSHTAPPPLILRCRDLCRLYGVSRSRWYEEVARGRAPMPLQLGPRSVGWIREEVEAYFRDLPRATIGQVAAR